MGTTQKLTTVLCYLKTSESWSGAVAGDVAWSYNPDLVATSETVFDGAGPHSVAFGYDSDLLLTCASPTSCSPVSADALRLTRHSQHGMVSQLSQGNVTEGWTYNSFGELASQVATAGGSPLIAFQYHTASAPRDPLGRITEKTETFAGTTKRIGYTYDVMGRLTHVTSDGTLTEHYQYDLNGNRLLGETPDGSSIGTYDAQDRLLSYGDLQYTYGANGELFTKTDTSTGLATGYTYDAFGNLTAVQLPDGRLIEYVTDGKHRRVGKKLDGLLVKQWLYRDQLNPVAELDGSGNLVARFVYGSRGHVPDFVLRSGAVYRIISDQVGSVRLVVNVADTSDVLFRAEYTAFGEMTVLDGDVHATPFGFAGGLFDADTRLTRFGARDYDPMVGRWTAKDPIGFRSDDGPNLYTYVTSDPVHWVDTAGFSGTLPIPMVPPWWAGIAMGAAAGAAAGSMGAGIGAVPGALIGACLGALLVTADTPQDRDRSCPPCPEPPGPQVHHDHGHWPCPGSHWHSLSYHQNPDTCECFLKRDFGGCCGEPGAPC
jgi:RHS repeat-associated protein